MMTDMFLFVLVIGVLIFSAWFISSGIMEKVYYDRRLKKYNKCRQDGKVIELNFLCAVKLKNDLYVREGRIDDYYTSKELTEEYIMTEDKAKKIAKKLGGEIINVYKEVRIDEPKQK